ncbi:hypothetical protein [Glycomyces xiaoerkulensis]|uniref:hypothetical protein n=1 Tax=Glycomyces xiaoerkulensis TaxID=2038139 RepID=UPI000C25A535|nr:hypothetical protein [Glycomyces xiaoerkulensis]
MVQLEEIADRARKLLVIAGVGALGTVGLAACGSDDDTADDPAEDASETAEAEEADEAADDEGEDPAVSYGDGTSPDAPLEPGATAEIADWTVSIGETVPDATDQILEAESMNDEPESGNVYFMFEIVATNNGEDAADPFMDLVWGVWDGGEEVGSEPLVLLPDDLVDVGDVATGESGSGNVVIEVPEGDYTTVTVGEMMGDEFYFSVV